MSGPATFVNDAQTLPGVGTEIVVFLGELATIYDDLQLSKLNRATGSGLSAKLAVQLLLLRGITMQGETCQFIRIHSRLIGELV